mgnify:CR=1 FL=1
MFGNLTLNQEAMNENSDRLGGGFQLFKSDIYRAKVEVAYATKSANGAMGLVVKFNVYIEGESKPRLYTQTFWLSNRQGQTFYVDKEGKSQNLAGFNHANHLTALCCNKSINEIATEERQIKLYNAEAKKEILTAVPCLVDLTGCEVGLAIIQRRVNKQEKSTSTGEYENTPEERFINEIDKIFAINGNMAWTFDERRNNLPAEFAIKWLDRWKDKVDDRYVEVKNSRSSGQVGTSTNKLAIG